MTFTETKVEPEFCQAQAFELSLTKTNLVIWLKLPVFNISDLM